MLTIISPEYLVERHAAMIEQSDVTYGDGKACQHCGEEMGWSECWNCGGAGAFDVYEEDPLWYDPGDEVMCEVCKGDGGFYICTNKHCAVKCGEE